jgi:hypothetical protein
MLTFSPRTAANSWFEAETPRYIYWHITILIRSPKQERIRSDIGISWCWMMKEVSHGLNRTNSVKLCPDSVQLEEHSSENQLRWNSMCGAMQRDEYNWQARNEDKTTGARKASCARSGKPRSAKLVSQNCKPCRSINEGRHGRILWMVEVSSNGILDRTTTPNLITLIRVRSCSSPLGKHVPLFRRVF